MSQDGECIRNCKSETRKGRKRKILGSFLKEGIRLKVGTSVSYSLGLMFALPPADRLS
jgi:hypothetical protein